MIKYICLIIFCVLSCVSCSSNILSKGFSQKDFKTNTGLYIAVKASDNDASIDVNVFYGNDYYNDTGEFCCEGIENDKCFVVINFIPLNDNKIKKELFTKKINDFYKLNYDCLNNNKLEYKSSFDYSILKTNLNEDGIIEIALSSISSDHSGSNSVFQRLIYKVAGKISFAS